jgi:hypothetical protein
VQAQNLMLDSLSRCKVLGKVTRHVLDKRNCGSIPYSGKGFLSFSKLPGQLWNPDSLVSSAYRDYFFGLKRPEREADQSPPCRAEV